VIVADGSLMGPEQPPPEQGEHSMRSGEKVFALGVPLHLWVANSHVGVP
jgi:hypothetical protein